MAIIQISEIVSNTRWAKEIRFFGIPVFLARELNVRTENEQKPSQIGFKQIGDVSLLDTEDDGV